MNHAGMEHVGDVMIMDGIPLWLLLAGMATVLLLSFVAIEWRKPNAASGFRVNLLANRRVYRFAKSRWFQAVPQLLMVILFCAIVFAGLTGSRIANITPVVVWTIWWAALIFMVLLFGSAWCFACPWDGLANLVTRLRITARVPPLDLGLRFPKQLRSLYPAIALFALLTWLELGYGVTTNPRSTAYLGLAMAAAAIGCALLFGGKQFCKYLCPVGRICGAYANVSPIEIRARKPQACRTCTTEDCRYGNESGYPCPTGISLKTVSSASMCTMCTECIKSCPRQNVAINLRPLASDLRAPRPMRPDAAWLVLLLLALTFFHGISMTPVWEDVRPGNGSILRSMQLGLSISRTLSFTIAMAIAVVIPIALYWLSCVAAARWARNEVTARTLFLGYAWSLLPIALFYHLAHNLMHLASEGTRLIPLLSDPLGTGANYFGTRDVPTSALLSPGTLAVCQVALVVIGHLLGIVVAHRISRTLYESRAARKSAIPLLLVMITFSMFGLWLMHLDMNMRIGRM